MPLDNLSEIWRQIESLVWTSLWGRALLARFKPNSRRPYQPRTLSAEDEAVRSGSLLAGRGKCTDYIEATGG